MARKFTSADIEITAKDKTKPGVTSAKTGVGKLTDTIKRYGAELAAVAVVVAGAIKIAKDLAEAYMVQEQAVAGLEAALRATGTYTPELSRDLQELAGELQKTTVYGDEATLAATGMLQSLAKLSGDGLMEAIPLVQELATGMKIDLVTAASLMGKTLGSSTNALSRYGIILDATAPPSEKLAALTEQIGDAFGGMSEAMGETFQGRLTRIQNAWGDIKEILGKFLLEQAEPVMTWLLDFLTNAENIKTITEIVKVFGAIFGTVFGYIIVFIKTTITYYKLWADALESLFKIIKVVFDPTQWGKGSIKEEVGKLKDITVLAARDVLDDWIAYGKKTGDRWTNLFGEQTDEQVKIVRNRYQLEVGMNADAREQMKEADQLYFDNFGRLIEMAQTNVGNLAGMEMRALEIDIRRPAAPAEMERPELPELELSAMQSFRAAEAGVEEAPELDLEPVESALSQLGGGFEGLLGSVGPIATLMGGPMSIALKALSIMFESMMEVLQPLIDSILAPLIGFFKLMGKIIGQTLAPMFKLLGDLMEALNPVLYIVYVVFKTVANVIQWFADVVTWVIRFLNPFKRAGRFPSLRDALADVMTYQEFKGDIIAGGTEEEERAGITPSTQTVTRPPDIYNTFNFNGTFIETSWERFIEMVTAEQERQRGLVVFGT